MTGEVEVVAWRETLLSEIVSDPNLPPMAKVALEALRADKERLEKERDEARKRAGIDHDAANRYVNEMIDLRARAERAEASLAGRDAEIAKLRVALERYEWLRDWYFRDGKRAEIHEHGHILQTTPDIFDAGVDAGIARARARARAQEPR